MNEPQTPAALDREAFQRVWRRVMPEDRLDCPFTLEEQTAAPDTAVQSPAAPTPTPPPVLSPPVQPSFVRPLPRTGTPSLLPICLGEQSNGDLPALEAMLALAADGWRIYRSLARQKGRQSQNRTHREGLFTTLAEGKQHQVRRLSAAHFLICGQEHTPLPTDAPAYPNLPAALRARFQAEQQDAVHLLAAANAAGDPCLMELYRTLALENQGFAKQLRDQLVKMMG